MKSLLKTAAVLAVLTSGAAQANEQFDFSYIFSSGDVITGSMWGNLDPTGLYIQNITNVQAFLDGVQFLNDISTGSLDATAWNTTTGTWDDTIAPVVSTNASLNNFAFGDTDVASNPSGVSNYFFFINDPTQGQQVFAVNTNNLDSNGNAQSAFDSPAATGAWTITAVPLPATLPMLTSGLAILGLAARRRAKA
ncbi:MAG: VPLPA-CTERM sorting domain-containing protein [Methylomonas sp.]|jgi:hypothetical protein